MRQRCWNHKALDIVDRLPKRLQPEARARLVAVWGSLTRADAERARDATVTWLRGCGQADAAATLLRDWDDLVTFYDFPVDQWRHPRTSNAIESVSAGAPADHRGQACADPRERALPGLQDRGEPGLLVTPAQRRGHRHYPAPHRRNDERRRCRWPPDELPSHCDRKDDFHTTDGSS